MLRGGFVSKAHCPKCGGNIYIDSDHYGWFEGCLMCGYVRNLKKMPAVKVDPGDKYMAQSESKTGHHH
jgi:hypothetical protein